MSAEPAVSHDERTALLVTIPGLPVAQGRPKACIRGGHAAVYDPAKSRSWKGMAQVHMQQAASEIVAPWRTPVYAAGLPLRVTIEAVWPQPIGAPKREHGLRRMRTSKPDADNVGKAVLDAGNGVLWADDSQVAVLVVLKVTGCRGEAPRVEVRVEVIATASPGSTRN